MTRRWKWNIIFWSVAIIHVIGLYFNWPSVYFTKPMIMLTLIYFYFFHARNFSIPFFAALVFALAGGLFLMCPEDHFFLLGLSCFLIMQVLYAVTFLQDRGPFQYKSLLPIVGILLMVISLLWHLWPGLEDAMKIAVPFYGVTIASMGISAALRDNTKEHYYPVAIGAFIFILSDACLAIDKFSAEFTQATIIIMISYICAQYLIVTGITKQ